MIDPYNITNYHRNDTQLQAFLLFCICVAGKRSEPVAQKINAWVDSMVDVNDDPVTPWRGLMDRWVADLLMDELEDFRIGNYTRMMQAIPQLLMLDPRTCTLDDLMGVHGVGPKTARMFLLHSRPNQRYAVLDTHINKWLRSEGINAPKGTPTDVKQYNKLEQQALALLDARGVTDFAHFDLNKWTEIKLCI
jgi:thermostable 8-oxoguanine DNA glycosylase